MFSKSAKKSRLKRINSDSIWLIFHVLLRPFKSVEARSVAKRPKRCELLRKCCVCVAQLARVCVFAQRNNTSLPYTLIEIHFFQNRCFFTRAREALKRCCVAFLLYRTIGAGLRFFRSVAEALRKRCALHENARKARQYKRCAFLPMRCVKKSCVSAWWFHFFLVDLNP